jgi:hypothetical protein
VRPNEGIEHYGSARVKENTDEQDKYFPLNSKTSDTSKILHDGKPVPKADINQQSPLDKKGQ